MPGSSIKETPTTLWAEIIAKADDYRFGDVLVRTDKRRLIRGPIYRVTQYSDHYRVDLVCAAELMTGGPWHSVSDELLEVRIPLTAIPRKCSDGCYTIILPDLGEVKLFGKGVPHCSLEPDLVTNYTPDEVRQSWARIYDLPLDCRWSELVEAVQELNRHRKIPRELRSRVERSAKQAEQVH